MDPKVPQYQRAVTPTIDNNNTSSPSLVRGKVLSYNANLIRGARVGAPDKLYGSLNIGASASARVSGSGSQSPRSTAMAGESARPSSKAGGVLYSSSGKQGQEVAGNADALAPAFSVLPRFDLVALSEDLPSDGIIFAKTKSTPETLVVFRTPEERLRNPERLNLDRRQLEVCPLLEQEQRLRLLNFQNNNIRAIQNLENLPNLIFLDLYNNKITSLEGPLSTVKGLRVLMAGKNKIGNISNIHSLRKLDVLDLHSNEIRVIEGLDGLSDLRVLNLAGNRITSVNNLSSLASLTELNLRRNSIDSVAGLNQLPALQRVFLSHNAIASTEAIRCLFEVNYLIELSLDGNPLSEADPAGYRAQLVAGMPGLRHLDLRRITDEERAVAVQLLGPAAKPAGLDNSGNDAEAGRPPRPNHGSGAGDYEGGRTAGYSSDDGSVNTNEGGSERSPTGDSGKAAGGQSSVVNGPGGGGELRRGLQKYIPSAGTGEAGRDRDGGAERGGAAATATGIATDSGGAGLNAAKGGQQPSSGLAALARAGKLFNTHSIFDLEVRFGVFIEGFRGEINIFVVVGYRPRREGTHSCRRQLGVDAQQAAAGERHRGVVLPHEAPGSAR
jgi:hypothetical protein